MLRTLVPVLAAAGALWPGAVMAYDKLPARLAAMTPRDIAAKVKVMDDPREPFVAISTEPAYTRGRTISGARADDVHLRALVDRQSGRVRWQVWHVLAFASGHKDIKSVAFESGSELRHVAPVALRHRPDRCPATDAPGLCGAAVHIAFEVPEPTVRAVAGRYVPGSREPWRVRFTDAAGRHVTGGIAPAEVRALIEVADDWRRRGGDRQAF